MDDKEISMVKNIQINTFKQFKKHNIEPEQALAILYDEIKFMFKMVLKAAPEERTIHKLMQTCREVDDMLEQYLIEELKLIRMKQP